MKLLRGMNFVLIALILSSCLTQQTNMNGQPPTQKSPAVTPTTIATVRLDNLPFDLFLDTSWKQILLRNPEGVVQNSQEEYVGLTDVTLTDVSDEYVQETFDLYAEILDALHQYDRATLSPDEQISYDIYEWYLTDQIAGREMIYYEYPATYFGTSVNFNTDLFFNDLHPLETKQDAEDYIARLRLVEAKYDGLIDSLKVREARGLLPPRFVFEWTLGGVLEVANSPATSTRFYTTLRDKLAAAGLPQDEVTPLLDDAEDAIDQSVIPAYQKLAAYLESMIAKAPTDVGAGQYPGGAGYYQYALRHHTSTDMTAEEIHQLGLDELDRIHAEMRAIFDQLGYPQDEDLSELYARVAVDGGTVSGDEVKAKYEAIIADADYRMAEAFDIRPMQNVIVVGDRFGGGYYVPGSPDGSRPGAFYANIGGDEPVFAMYTLTYHEAIPGHHTQIALAQESDLAVFRRGAEYTAFVEGWALYAERLAWELGWYDGNPYGDLGRLQGEAFRAARLVVDTGIHAKGWTFEQAVTFFMENTGHSRGFSENQIARYVVWPGQATAYMIGMQTILAGREHAKAELGDKFDLRAFHRAVLLQGAMPLDVYEEVVDHFIEANR